MDFRGSEIQRILMLSGSGFISLWFSWVCGFVLGSVFFVVSCMGTSYESEKTVSSRSSLICFPESLQQTCARHALFSFFLRFYLFIHERQREKWAPCGEPDVGFHPRTLGSYLSQRLTLSHRATQVPHARCVLILESTPVISWSLSFIHLIWCLSMPVYFTVFNVASISVTAEFFLFVSFLNFSIFIFPCGHTVSSK